MGERILILVRHGESEWNLKNLFTGWKNPDLTQKGIGEARNGPGPAAQVQGLYVRDRLHFGTDSRPPTPST